MIAKHTGHRVLLTEGAEPDHPVCRRPGASPADQANPVKIVRPAAALAHFRWFRPDCQGVIRRFYGSSVGSGRTGRWWPARIGPHRHPQVVCRRPGLNRQAGPNGQPWALKGRDGSPPCTTPNAARSGDLRAATLGRRSWAAHETAAPVPSASELLHRQLSRFGCGAAPENGRRFLPSTRSGSQVMMCSRAVWETAGGASGA